MHGGTLAALPIEVASAVAKVRGGDFLPYYEFAQGLLYAALNQHTNGDAECVSMAIHLALKLLRETAPVPAACERFAKLLKQAAKMCQGPEQMSANAICKTLEAQLRSSAHADVSAICLTLPSSVVKVTGMSEAITEMLRAVPPTDDWKLAVCEEVAKLCASDATYQPVAALLQQALSGPASAPQ